MEKILKNMTTSTAIVSALATTTGQIMTDSIPLLTYFLGIIFVLLFLSLIFGGIIKPIKKIFK